MPPPVAPPVHRRYAMKHMLRRTAAFALAAIVLAFTANIASADGPGFKTISQDFNGLLFGLNVSSGDELLVAEGGNGAVNLDPDGGEKTLLASLPGISDVIQVGRREYLALTGEGDPSDPNAESLFRIKNGTVAKIADLGAFEEAVDPARDDVESNPFDLAKLSRNKTLVADAAGNSVLVVDKNGSIDWVATLPQHDIPTQPIKDVAGCPLGPPDICGLPDIFNADPVSTTVAVGPDGAIYVGELTGFPASPGQSRIWRIERGELHVRCGADPECTQVDAGSFTSIIDIQFGEDGTAYVVEIDENSWLAAEFGLGVGGTVNACRTHGDEDDDDEGVAWSCEEIATGLPFPLAVAIDDESVYVTLAHGFEGPFEVAVLTDGDGDGEDEDDD